MKFILPFLLACGLASAATQTVGPSGQGITVDTRSAFLDALGGTTAGKALFQLANPSAVSFLRVNADNSATWRSASQYRTDLGLGTAATTDATAYATAAQGVKADTAVQNVITSLGYTPANVATTRTIDKSPFNLVFAGDSILQGVTSGGATAGNYLQDRLPLKSYFSGRTTIVDTAVAGRTSATVISNYTSEVYPYRPSNQSGKRGILLVLAGTNNPAGDSDATVATNVTNLLTYCSTAISDGFEVWLCTLMPRNAAGSVNQWDGYNRRFRQSNIPIKVIDLNFLFRDSTDTTTLGDNLHPTNLGYDLIAEFINAQAWNDERVARTNFGTAAKLNTDNFNFTGGGGTHTTKVTFSLPDTSSYPEVTGTNAPSILFRPNGGTKFYQVVGDGSTDLFTFISYDGVGFRTPLTLKNDSTMVATFGGDVATSTGKTLQIKSGANSLAGTFTLSTGTATITSTAIDVNTVIVPTIKTSGGTPGTAMPKIVVSAGSAAVTGLSTDTSTYNWVALKVN